MTYATERYDIETAMDGVLAGQTRPMPTRVLAEKVCFTLGLTNVDRVSSILLDIAKTDARATHNGPTKTRFGRTMTGWLWHAEPQTEGSVFKRSTPSDHLIPYVPLKGPVVIPPGMMRIIGSDGVEYIGPIPDELKDADSPDEDWTVEPGQ